MGKWFKGCLQVEQAFIKVEQIRGPILLFSGADDKVWPSNLMSQMIERRLKELDFQFTMQNIIYQNAGHMISGDPNRINTIRNGQIIIKDKSYEYEYGGTAEADNLAQLDAREKVFVFISNL